MIIAIDFDGTITTHEFPNVGSPIPDAIRVMKRLQAAGHKLILWTMRSDIENPTSDSKEICSVGGKYLTDALEYCSSQGIEFWGVNTNPEQSTWTHSPKVYAHMYIDDAAYGCPLVHCKEGSYVDWNAIELRFDYLGYFDGVKV